MMKIPCKHTKTLILHSRHAITVLSSELKNALNQLSSSAHEVLSSPDSKTAKQNMATAIWQARSAAIKILATSSPSAMDKFSEKGELMVEMVYAHFIAAANLRATLTALEGAVSLSDDKAHQAEVCTQQAKQALALATSIAEDLALDPSQKKLV